MLPKVVGEEVYPPKNSFNVSNTESSILLEFYQFTQLQGAVSQGIV